GFERLNQTRPVRTSIDTQTSLDGDALCSHHVRADFRLTGQQEALKGCLDVREAAHAARARARLANSRAVLSSEHNSSRAGILSSRSIMVETQPKRRTAALYNSHTGSGTGWSWVSMR